MKKTMKIALGIVIGLVLAVSYNAAAQFYQWPSLNVGTLPWTFQDSSGVTKASVDANGVLTAPSVITTSTAATGALVMPATGRLCLEGTSCAVTLASTGTNATMAGAASLAIGATGTGNLNAFQVQAGTAGNSNLSLRLFGTATTGASAIGAKIGNAQALSTAGAKIAAFYSDGATTEEFAIDKDGAPVLAQKCDTSGTPNTSSTCNQAAGKVQLSSTNSVYTLTNSLVAATSNVAAQIQFVDTTCKSIVAVPTANTITMTTNAACAANAAISWWIVAK